MKMLLIHCDYFSYLTTQRTKVAEEISNDCKSCVFKDVLVVFITVEKIDEENPNMVIVKGVEEIASVAKNVGARAIVLFPFVHLSEDVSNAGMALEIIKGLYESLKPLKYAVDKAPFGWEKVFSLTSKGHPLAELSRTIRP